MKLWILAALSLCGCVGSADVSAVDASGEGGPITDAIPDAFASRTLRLSGPTNLAGSICSEPFVLSRAFTNDDGDPTADTTVALLTGSGRGTYYGDAGCKDVVDSVTIAPGTSSTTFHLKVPVAESLVLHADDAAHRFAPAAFQLAVKPTALTVEALYPAASAWNSYVKDDGEDAFGASGVGCDSKEVPCHHGGELKRVKLPGLSDCDEVDYGDALGVLEWICRPDAAGGLSFFSKGLRRDRGLRDLVTATSWKKNHFEVRIDGVVARSEDVAWWSNPVRPLPKNPTSPWIVIDDKDDDDDGPDEAIPSGTILTVDGPQQTNGYNINIDGVGLVTLGQATLTYADATTENCQQMTGDSNKGYNSHVCLLSAGQQQFVWLEGDFDGDDDADFLLNMVALTHSTVRRFVARKGRYGVALRDSSYNRITAAIEDTAATGWDIDDSSNNLIDGAVTRKAGGEGMSIGNSNDNVLRDVLIEDAKEQALYFASGSNNLFINLSAVGDLHDTSALTIYGSDNQFIGVRAHHNNGYGLLVGGDRNRFVDVIATNNRHAGVQVSCSWLGPTGNSFVGVVAAANGSGVSVTTTAPDKRTQQNTFSHVTAINNTGNGVSVNSSDLNVLHQVISANNGDDGFSISGGSNNNRVHDLVSIDNGDDQINVSYASDSLFHGRLIVGGSATPCRVVEGTRPGLINQTCTIDGNPGKDYGAETSDAVYTPGAKIANAFVGKVSSDDKDNSSDNKGTQLASSITDWHHFDAPYRFWGQDGGAFPSADNRSRCLEGTCRIWDVGLRASPSSLSLANGAFASGSFCPDTIGGDLVIVDQQSEPNTFLAAAAEVTLDGLGDDDGLCESDEACVFSPHLGAYQGHGKLVGSCAFDNGIVSDVSLQVHSDVGY